MISLYGPAAVLLATWAPPARALPPGAETCLGCHSGSDAAPAPDLKGFERSAHAGLDCASCHAEAAQALRTAPHGRAILKRFGEGPKACGACHGRGHQISKASEKRSPVSRALHERLRQALIGWHVFDMRWVLAQAREINRQALASCTELKIKRKEPKEP